MKVAIAEDNSFFREGLERLLSTAGVEVSAVHHSGQELLTYLNADDLARRGDHRHPDALRRLKSG